MITTREGLIEPEQAFLKRSKPSRWRADGDRLEPKDSLN
jgi:hypothetical protein